MASDEAAWHCLAVRQKTLPCRGCVHLAVATVLPEWLPQSVEERVEFHKIQRFLSTIPDNPCMPYFHTIPVLSHDCQGIEFWFSVESRSIHHSDSIPKASNHSRKVMGATAGEGKAAARNKF